MAVSDAVLNQQVAAARAYLLARGSSYAKTDKSVLDSSTNPYICSVASQGFTEDYTRHTATTGSSKQRYFSHQISGAGCGGGDCVHGVIRNSTTGLTSYLNGVHGHVILDNGSTLGAAVPACGVRATMEVAASATPVGILSPLRVENNMGAGVTLPANNASLIYINEAGTIKMPLFITMNNVDTAAMFTAATSTTPTQKLKCRINGTDYWICLTATA